MSLIPAFFHWVVEWLPLILIAAFILTFWGTVAYTIYINLIAKS